MSPTKIQTKMQKGKAAQRKRVFFRYKVKGRTTAGMIKGTSRGHTHSPTLHTSKPAVAHAWIIMCAPPVCARINLLFLYEFFFSLSPQYPTVVSQHRQLSRFCPSAFLSLRLRRCLKFRIATPADVKPFWPPQDVQGIIPWHTGVDIATRR